MEKVTRIALVQQTCSDNIARNQARGIEAVKKAADHLSVIRLEKLSPIPQNGICDAA